MANFWLKIFNTLAFLAFFSSNAYSIAFPSSGHITYLSAAPFAQSVWGLIHLLFFGFIIFQWLPGFEGKDELIHESYSWNFIVTGVLTSIWLQLWELESQTSLILAWIVTIIIASNVSLIYYRLSFERSVSGSFLETLFVRTPISLYTGWITYIVWLGFATAFTGDVSESGPTLWDRFVVYAFFFLAVPNAIFYTRSKFTFNGYGDPVANLALGWAIFGVAVYQDDFWISTFGYVSAVLVLLANIEPLFWGRSTSRGLPDLERASAEERAPLVQN
ncbi:hypothetical protein HK096_004899 [Nowakowskiella sp. JEL0078]|nr:hypothetical protein HK096_004899 [Nowakowskiella sp. JEL0078]